MFILYIYIIMYIYTHNIISYSIKVGERVSFAGFAGEPDQPLNYYYYYY